MNMFSGNVAIVIHNDLELTEGNSFCGKKSMDEGKEGCVCTRHFRNLFYMTKDHIQYLSTSRTLSYGPDPQDKK